jgi:hypothetical protein
MLTTLLLLRLILAFAVGSIWVSAVTVITERKGTAWGILGGLPSTAAISLLFIGLNQSIEAAVDTSVVLPLIFSVSNAFLLFYAVLAKKGFGKGLGMSLLVWFAASAAIVVYGISDYIVCLTFGGVISIIIFFMFTKLELPQFGSQDRLYGNREIAIRGLIAGSLVASSVLLSQTSGPIIGGIGASFPAVYTSTIIILKYSRGTDFSRSMTKSLAFSGILTVIPYSVAVHFLYPTIGVWIGTLLSYLVVLPLAFLAYTIVKHHA